MTNQFALDFALSHYPHIPGYRDNDTSRAAAEDIAKAAKLMRERVYAVIAFPMSDWEIASASGLNFETAQPRRSELLAAGRVVFADCYGVSPRSGKRVKKWRRADG